MELDRDVEIVHLYHCKSQGSQYNSINSDKALYIKASAYVDDINTHHNVTNKQQTLEDIMKHDFKQWKSILEVRGGSLAMEKCNFCTARWNFHNSGRPEMKDCQVKIMHFQDIGTVINSIVCHHKTLGYYISPITPSQSQRFQWQEIETDLVHF